MKVRFALLSCAALMLCVPAAAQNATVESRVGKLEKEMRAVQRKVFPDGAGKFLEPEIQAPDTVRPATTTSTATADLLVRVDALESQLAALTGQVEQQGNAARAMEARIKALETQMSAQSTSAQAASPLPAAASAPAPVVAAATSKPAATKPAAAAKPSAARTAAVSAIEKPATGDAFEDGYNYGYRLWEAKFYPEAQTQLEDVIAKHPKHKRLSFARNLLGRAWLDDKKPATAVKVFYDNYKNEPKGERASDSLFFLGSALTDLGKNAEACEAFAELGRAYPDAATGRLAERMTAGRARAKCK